MYYQDTQDLLAAPGGVPLLPTPSGFTAYEQNVDSSSAASGELGLESNAATGLRWNINYAYICGWARDLCSAQRRARASLFPTGIVLRRLQL